MRIVPAVTRATVHLVLDREYFFSRGIDAYTLGRRARLCARAFAPALTGRAKEIDKRNHVSRKLVLLPSERKGKKYFSFKSVQWRSLRYLDEYVAAGLLWTQRKYYRYQVNFENCNELLLLLSVITKVIRIIYSNIFV